MIDLETLWDDLLIDLGIRPPQGPPLPAPLPPAPSSSKYGDDFEYAIKAVLMHEGGLVNNPADPGGLTNMGISLRSYPNLGEQGIRDLTVEQAKDIYYSDWWMKYRWNRLPMPEAGKVFDLGVNMGAKSANECLQLALRDWGHELNVDGEIGPTTLEAAQHSDPVQIMEALRAHAIEHYKALVNEHPKLQRFLAGWINRVNS